VSVNVFSSARLLTGCLWGARPVAPAISERADLIQSLCGCETDQLAVPPVHLRGKADLRAQAGAVFEYCLGRAERKQ